MYLPLAGWTHLQQAKTAPKNYLFLSSGFEGVPERMLKRKDVEGVQIIYSWKQLEPAKDRYDFDPVERDLKQANALGKRLFIQIQDRFFSADARNIPMYMLKDPIYHGGLAPQVDNPGEGKAATAGWVAEQWNLNVRTRFQSLLRALGKQFDGRVEGVNLPESSADIEADHDTTGFTPSGYFRAELENAEVARQAFRKSFVVQYVNFWPGEWNNDHHFMGEVFRFAQVHRIGLGGPDVVPYRPGQMANSYPFFHAFRGRLPLVAMAVQEPTLTYRDPSTGKPFTRQKIVRFAQDYLGANIIFWTPKAPWLSEP